MPASDLQSEFLRVFADGHRATAKRIVAKLNDLGLSPNLRERADKIVAEEIRGLYHGSLVIFDGGSTLADRGWVRIVDDKGAAFATNLHEVGFEFYDVAGRGDD
jgi:hypothetical protein